MQLLQINLNKEKKVPTHALQERNMTRSDDMGKEKNILTQIAIIKNMQTQSLGTEQK